MSEVVLGMRDTDDQTERQRERERERQTEREREINSLKIFFATFYIHNGHSLVFF